MALTVEPVEAIISLMTANWAYTVWEFGTNTTPLTRNKHIVDQANYRNWEPPNNNEYIIVSVPGPSRSKNLGHYSHYIAKHPLNIEVHSRRSRARAVLGKEEILRICSLARKDPTLLGNDYRKLWIIDRSLDRSTHQVYKYIVKVELEESLNAYV